MNGIKLGNVECIKDLSVMIASSIKFSQQLRDAAGTANTIPRFINRNFSFKNQNIILPLYISLVRPYLGYAAQFWSLQH